MKVYTSREVHKHMRKSGWSVVSTKGDHFKYIKNGVSVVIPLNVNRMVIQRLDKTYHLGIFR